MDTADLSLQQFLIKELQCVPLQKGVVSLEAVLNLQRNPPHYLSDVERRDILNAVFKPEDYSHFLLRLGGGISFEIAKVTVRRYYLETGYDIAFDYDCGSEFFIEVRSGADVVRISCMMDDADVLNVLVV